MSAPFMRTSLVLCAAILVLAACGSSHSSGGSGNTVTLRSSELAVTIQKAPFHIAVADARGPLLAETTATDRGSLAYWRGDVEQHVVRASAPPTRDGDRVTFEVETTEGA